MTYQPGIPTGSVPLNQDYLNIQANFTQLNDQFSIDHVPLNSTSGTPPNGYHTVLHLVPPSTTTSNPPNNQPPNGFTATPGYGQVLAPQINDGINTDEALFYLTGGNKLIQLTRNVTPGLFVNNYTPQAGGGPVGTAYTAGTTFLPGGMLMQYGLVTGGNSPPANGTVKYPFTFKTLYGVFVSPGLTGTPGSTFSIGVRTASTTDFTFFTEGSSTLTAFNWFAIGI